jgi:hypothetical protein
MHWISTKVYSRSKILRRSPDRSAEHSKRRKGTPFQSAMSMLAFYINRAGDGLPAKRRNTFESAQDELRKTFRKTD